MAKKLPAATHNGEILLGGLALPVSVLDDGTHVFSERALLAILGAKGRGAMGGHRIASILQKLYVNTLINKATWVDIEVPVRYIRNGRESIGYKSVILGHIIKALSQAKRLGILKTEAEQRYARNAEILRDALVDVAVDALIDEVTGYQEIRDKDALQKILDKYLRRELAAWAKRFPDEFYKEMFRLKKWQWKGMKINRPSVVGTYTKDVVYERLVPGLLDELERRNPRTIKGHRAHKHHQWLTEEIGHPKLRDHLIGVVALMKASPNWNNFLRSLARAFPRTGDQIEMTLDD